MVLLQASLKKKITFDENALNVWWCISSKTQCMPRVNVTIYKKHLENKTVTEWKLNVKMTLVPTMQVWIWRKDAEE